jgi:hypothetical protein
MKLWHALHAPHREAKASYPIPHHYPFLRKHTSPHTAFLDLSQSVHPAKALRRSSSTQHLHDDPSTVTSTPKQASQLPLTRQRSPHSPRLQASSRYRQQSTTAPVPPKPAVRLTPNRNHSRACMRPAEFSACQSPGRKTGHRIGLSSCALAPPSCCLQEMPYNTPPLLMVGPPACSNGRLYLRTFPSLSTPRTDIDK